MIHIKNEKYQELFLFGVIAVLMFIPMISLGDKLGIYADAINSEYGGQMIFSPENDRYHQYHSFGILSQIYRGIPNLYVSMLATLLTGTTSVLQHHLVVAMIAFACIVSFYYVLKKLAIKQEIAMGVTLLLATLPSIFTVQLTQFHVTLPGILCVLISILCFLMWREKQKENILFISAWLMGFSFYSYYMFLFFFPCYLVCIMSFSKTRKEKIKHMLFALLGFLCGCVLYIVGYTEIFLRMRGYIQRQSIRTLCALFVAVVIYVVSLFIYKMIQKEKWKYVSISIVIGGILGLCWLLAVFPSIRSIASALNIQGYSATIKDRICLVLTYISGALTGVDAEQLMYSAVYSRLLSLFKLLFLLTNILYFIILLKNRKNVSIKREHGCQFIAIFLVYMICGILFASRQGVQHYIPVVFLLFIIFGAQLDFIIKNISIKKDFCRILWISGLMVCILVNSFNKYQIMHQIEKTGGTGYYTNQLNELAYDALEKRQEGKKEIYLFPEWGFFTSFSYLTHNEVAFFGGACNSDVVNWVRAKGYTTIVVCYWDPKNTEKYKEIMRQSSQSEIQEEVYHRMDGEEAFYLLRQ